MGDITQRYMLMNQARLLRRTHFLYNISKDEKQVKELGEPPPEMQIRKGCMRYEQLHL